MRIFRLLAVFSLIAVLVIPATAMAKGLSGEKYGFALLGARDYDRYSDPSISIKLGANIPINQDLDITPFFVYETVDSDAQPFGPLAVEVTSFTLAVRGDYFITERGSMKIYAGGGMGFVHKEYDYPTYSTDDDDLLFQAHGGLDMDLGEKIGLRPECAYQRIGDDDDVNCGAMFNLKLGESFDLLAEARFFLDNREIFYSIGGGLKF